MRQRTIVSLFRPVAILAAVVLFACSVPGCGKVANTGNDADAAPTPEPDAAPTPDAAASSSLWDRTKWDQERWAP